LDGNYGRRRRRTTGIDNGKLQSTSPSPNAASAFIRARIAHYVDKYRADRTEQRTESTHAVTAAAAHCRAAGQLQGTRGAR